MDRRSVSRPSKTMSTLVRASNAGVTSKLSLYSQLSFWIHCNLASLSRKYGSAICIKTIENHVYVGARQQCRGNFKAQLVFPTFLLDPLQFGFVVAEIWIGDLYQDHRKPCLRWCAPAMPG